MIVQVKVLQNADEINEAKSKNEFYAKKRKQNETIAKSKRELVPDDVDIPEQIIEPSDLLLDVEDIKTARINEIGMISIFHLYKGEMQIIHTPEVWEKLQKRFS